MQAHPDSAAGLLGRGLEALGLKKKAQTEEEEIPSWHPAQEPMSEVESKSFRHRQPSGKNPTRTKLCVGRLAAHGRSVIVHC